MFPPTSRNLVIASCVLLGALAANAQPRAQGPALFDPAADASVERLLAGAADGDSLTRAMGRPAMRCYPVGSSWELCEWRLSPSDPGWHELASVMGTRDRVSVLCVLPSNGSPRDPQSCTAHVRRSNRDRWKVQRRAGENRADKRRSVLYETKHHYREVAIAMLDEARTLIALSRLLGEVPSVCIANRSELNCLWRTTSHTWGHGTLATAADVSSRKKLRFECALPIDGGLRALDSCRIQVGA